MKMPKTSLIAFVFLCVVSQTHAQIRFPVTNNDLRNNLQKVIADFPNGLNDIKGNVTSRNPQTIEYTTVLKFDAAEDNTITQYISAKPIYSWQAVLLTTEDFEEAAKKYKWLCNQLKVMTIKMGDGYTFSLNGNYEAPTESKDFNTSTFKLTPAATYLPRLKIEVGMQFYFPEWKVNLTVYQKEREDNERGDINDDIPNP
jgi:hypothetical protein